MEDVMYARVMRQTKAVGDGIDMFHHLKRAHEAQTELPALAGHQGLRWAVKKP